MTRHKPVGRFQAHNSTVRSRVSSGTSCIRAYCSVDEIQKRNTSVLTPLLYLVKTVLKTHYLRVFSFYLQSKVFLILSVLSSTAIRHTILPLTLNKQYSNTNNRQHNKLNVCVLGGKYPFFFTLAHSAGIKGELL